MTAASLPSLRFDLRRFLPTRLTTLSNHLMRRAAKVYAQRFKLSAPEWRIVIVLGQQGTMSTEAIITLSTMDKVRVSRGVAKLMEAGLVTRESDMQDRRRAIIALTARGREIYRQIVPLIQDAEAEMLATLSETERAALTHALEKIEEYLKRTGGEAEADPDKP